MEVMGEVRVYVGGRYELLANADEFYYAWIRGNMIAKARYHNKGARSKIIKKALEMFEEIEIGIIPDIADEEE